MSAKFDEFPSLPFQDIKEKPKRHRRTDGKTDGQRENSIPPTDIVCGGYNKIYVEANVMNIYAKFQLHPPYGF